MNRFPEVKPASKLPRTLVLGAGRKPDPAAVNLDLSIATRPDLCSDLDRVPWPFADGCFDQVVAHDVVEHLDDLLATFEEIHRVCRPGAVVRLTVPHFTSANAFTDPTHRHFFSHSSLGYFTGENEFDFYTRVRFRRRHSRLIFHPSALNRVVSRLANRFPERYERRWGWIFPAWFLYFELETLPR